MKVGIITYQYAYNYGAILQCLALQRALGSIGINAEIINYLHPQSKKLPFYRGWGFSKLHFFETFPQRLIGLRYEKSMRKKIDSFRNKYLNLSTPCYTMDEIRNIVDDYDAIVAGSDQIWRFEEPPVYFLEWGKLYKGKRISYAPSCGMVEQPLDNVEDVSQWLQRFDYLSVRDDFSKSIVNRVTGRLPDVVADPTLLVDLMDIYKNLEIPHKEYIFVYILGEEIAGEHKNIIRSIRDKYGNIPIVAAIASAHKPKRIHWADYKVWDVDPGEWLFLLSNAKFVYTDSFHCTLFALKHKKPFLTYFTESKRSPRLIDMAERYAISSCIVQSVKDASEKRFWDELDYEKIDHLINTHVEKSYKFLKNALFPE